MALTELLSKGNGWAWADTGKSARISYKIGEPLHWVIPTAHVGLLDKNLGMLLDSFQFYDREKGLPKKTEIAYQVLEKHLDADPPYLKIQYFEAKR